MLDYTLLETLSAVIRGGSFEAAARALHVSAPAVSQRIRALEDRMGAALVRRGPPAEPTEAGRRLVRHAEQVALLERALDRSLAPVAGEDLAVARLAVNADSLATWALPALAAVPGLLFDVVIDDQDHSAALLRRGEVQAAVTAQAAPVAGCDCVALGRLGYVATASPAFAARWFADGVTAAALAAAPALVFSPRDRLQADWARAVTGTRIALRAHHLASSHGFVAAARLGLGWGMNPRPLVAGALARGALVELLPGRGLETPLYWQVSRISAAALAPLTRAIRREARARLLPPAAD